MCAAANKIPTTLASGLNLSDQSYLLLSPLQHQDSSSPEDNDSDEPDIRRDDVTFRSNRDLNAGISQEPQPRFGIPVGPVTGGANSDYLHAIPKGKYRSTFHPMRTPDVVKDDLAFRGLRKDSNQSDPDHLGIVKDPNGIILPRRAWPFYQDSSRSSPLVFYPNKHGKAMRSLSEGITDVIKKQSCNPAGEVTDLISYPDIVDISIENSKNSEKSERKSRKNARNSAGKSTNRRSMSAGRTVFELLRFQEEEEISQSDSADTEDIADTSSIDEGVVVADKSEDSANTSVEEGQDISKDASSDERESLTGAECDGEEALCSVMVDGLCEGADISVKGAAVSSISSPEVVNHTNKHSRMFSGDVDSSKYTPDADRDTSKHAPDTGATSLDTSENTESSNQEVEIQHTQELKYP